MKKIILYCCALLFVLVSLVGCGVPAENGGVSPEPGSNELYPSFTAKGNEMRYDAQSDGITIAGDTDYTNDFESIADKFRGVLEAESIFTCDSAVLNFKFTDEIPKKIKWYEYYMTEDGSFIYASDEDRATEEGAVEHVVDETSGSTVIDFGQNRDALLSSSDNAVIYRCIRLLCEYDDEQVEYLMLFKSDPLIYPGA